MSDDKNLMADFEEWADKQIARPYARPGDEHAPDPIALLRRMAPRLSALLQENEELREKIGTVRHMADLAYRDDVPGWGAYDLMFMIIDEDYELSDGFEIAVRENVKVLTAERDELARQIAIEASNVLREQVAHGKCIRERDAARADLAAAQAGNGGMTNIHDELKEFISERILAAGSGMYYTAEQWASNIEAKFTVTRRPALSEGEASK
jgi:hypothetical protein